MQNTLILVRKKDEPNEDFFLLFDTEVTENDIHIIKENWKKIAEEHPTWDKYDIVAELTENVLPKFGLQGQYITPRQIIDDMI